MFSKIMSNKLLIIIIILLNLLILSLLTFNIRSELRELYDQLNSNLLMEKNNFDLNQLFEKSGLIIHIRHSTRAPSDDVHSFDFMEHISQEKHKFIKSYTCLDDLGRAQSELIGFLFNYYKVPYSAVYASSSCRSIENAVISFGDNFTISSALLYYGMFDKSEYGELDEELTVFLNGTIIKSTSNVVLIGHNLIPFEDSRLLDRSRSDLTIRSQGGVSIIEMSENNEIIILKTYKNLSEFQKALEANKLNINN